MVTFLICVFSIIFLLLSQAGFTYGVIKLLIFFNIDGIGDAFSDKKKKVEEEVIMSLKNNKSKLNKINRELTEEEKKELQTNLLEQVEKLRGLYGMDED